MQKRKEFHQHVMFAFDETPCDFLWDESPFAFAFAFLFYNQSAFKTSNIVSKNCFICDETHYAFAFFFYNQSATKSPICI